MKDISEAEEFYEEFLEVAPNDNTRYILKYKICKENRFLWMNRSESRKNTKRKNLQSAGPMNWQNCIIRMEILRSV